MVACKISKPYNSPFSENLGGGCSYCYQTKVKSTPRFGLGWEFDNSLNIVIKHAFIFSNPYIYAIIVQDCSPEVDEIEGKAEAATKHMELLKQKGQDRS